MVVLSGKMIPGVPSFHFTNFCIILQLECLRVLIGGVGNGVTVHPGMTTSRFTQTPAHIAAFAGHPHCLQWLLQTGLDPNAQVRKLHYLQL